MSFFSPVRPTLRWLEVFVTDALSLAQRDWPQVRVISIAPLIAGAVQRFLANASLGELY
jgi:phosphoribosylpyrophosphate synthetase